MRKSKKLLVSCWSIITYVVALLELIMNRCIYLDIVTLANYEDGVAIILDQVTEQL